MYSKRHSVSLVGPIKPKPQVLPKIDRDQLSQKNIEELGDYPSAVKRQWNKQWGIAKKIPLTDSFDIGDEPAKWNPTPEVLSLIQHSFQIAFFFGPIRGFKSGAFEIILCLGGPKGSTKEITKKIFLVPGLTVSIEVFVAIDIGEVQEIAIGHDLGPDVAIWVEEVHVLDRTLAREHTFASQQWLQDEETGKPMVLLRKKFPSENSGLKPQPVLVMTVVQLRAHSEEKMKIVIENFLRNARKKNVQIAHVEYNGNKTAADIHILVSPITVGKNVQNNVGSELITTAARAKLTRTEYISKLHAQKTLQRFALGRILSLMFADVYAAQYIQSSLHRHLHHRRYSNLLLTVRRTRGVAHYIRLKAESKGMTPLQAIVRRLLRRHGWIETERTKFYSAMLLTACFARCFVFVIPRTDIYFPPPPPPPPPPPEPLPFDVELNLYYQLRTVIDLSHAEDPEDELEKEPSLQDIQQLLINVSEAVSIPRLQAYPRLLLQRRAYLEKLDRQRQWRAFAMVRKTIRRWKNLRLTSMCRIQASIRRRLVNLFYVQSREAERWWATWKGHFRDNDTPAALSSPQPPTDPLVIEDLESPYPFLELPFPRRDRVKAKLLPDTHRLAVGHVSKIARLPQRPLNVSPAKERLNLQVNAL